MVSSVGAECTCEDVNARLVGASVAGSFWCDGYGNLAPLRVGVAVRSDITTRFVVDESPVSWLSTNDICLLGRSLCASCQASYNGARIKGGSITKVDIDADFNTAKGTHRRCSIIRIEGRESLGFRIRV